MIDQNDATPHRPGKTNIRMYRALWDRPGYLVRRLHQIHIGLFAEECGAREVTPIQFGMLSVLYDEAGLDQLSLSTAVGVDRTSGADVIKRLVGRNLATREPSRQDRRAKIIRITAKGKQFVEEIRPLMARAQERFVAPLSEQEQVQFTDLINKIIKANNQSSRAPLA